MLKRIKIKDGDNLVRAFYEERLVAIGAERPVVIKAAREFLKSIRGLRGRDRDAAYKTRHELLLELRKLVDITDAKIGNMSPTELAETFAMASFLQVDAGVTCKNERKIASDIRENIKRECQNRGIMLGENA